MGTDTTRKWHSVEKDGYTLIINEGGTNIAYSRKSNVKIIEQDGFAFKDLNGDGKLDKYEDWRLPIDERIEDLVSQMSIEQIAGLMLYSKHQTVTVPDPNDTFALRFAGTYDGKPFDPAVNTASDLTDQQKEFLSQDELRHILMTQIESEAVAAHWNNNIQEYCEGHGLGIPANISSDPRHGAASNGEFFVGAKGQISQWPSELGIAASFDPEVALEFGKVMSKEYRAIGITTALSPQIDLASDPRWNRYNGTFGEGVELNIDLTRAYVDGCQTTDDTTDGWGPDSVNAMVKHWPGGGTGEGGRDAHFNYGKYAVYPGNNHKEHMRPFTEGAFHLNGKTDQASAIMPYYTISYNVDTRYGENVGNGYSKYLINDILREEYGYDGVCCSDWGITGACNDDEMICGMNWGVAHLSEDEMHYKALLAGIDQFGGNNDKEPVLAAYRMGCATVGEEAMRARMERSAKRLLRNIMRPGLFENPYLDANDSLEIVGNPDFMASGYNAQKKSIVLLKNEKQLLPLAKGTKVYVPDCPDTLLYGMPALFAPDLNIPGHPWMSPEQLGKYFTVVSTPEEADVAIVFMEGPHPFKPGYSKETGYVPISLQYRPYTATAARAQSIAQGDPFWPKYSDTPNRSYLGKTNTCANEKMLDTLEATRAAMGDKPVITVIDVIGPMLMTEVEPLSDALMVGFELQKQAYLDIITGEEEPSGLLPFQIPADMETVEKACEDVPRSRRCYVDSIGHKYDFAYGMNYSDVIDDDRVKKYY